MEKVSLPLTKGMTIVVEKGVQNIKVDMTFGNYLAVHRAFDPKRGWAISHIPTGLAVTFLDTKEKAMQCAEECAELDWSSVNIINCFKDSFLSDVRSIISRHRGGT